MLKRGVSPLIATVLIIGFTVALGAVIVLWGQGFIKEMQHESTLKEEKASRCIATSISITNPEQTKPDEATFILENLGSYPVNSIIIRVTGDKGVDSATQPGMSVGEKKARTISFDATKVGIVKELEVVPTLDIEGEAAPCTPGMKTALELPEATAEQWAIFCGDGNINDWEKCDNDELGMGIFPPGTDCTSKGFAGGTLLCTEQCALDTTLCEEAAPEEPGIPNLMAWWTMDNNLDDSSGNGATLSCTNCPTYTAGGAKGGAYEFDGIDDTMISLATSALNTDTFTITAWIKSGVVVQDTWDGIVISRDSGVNQGILVSGTAQNKLAYIWENVGTDYNFAGPTFSPVQWQFIALVIEPTKATMYLNSNVLVNTMAHGPKPMNVRWVLGRDPAMSDRFWKGGIDDVRLWNRSLSAEEINLLYTDNIVP